MTIWPDNDEPGRRYADAVADALLALGCPVRVIDVEKLGLPPKGDAVDWLAANPAATAAEIAALPCVEARRAEPRSGNRAVPAASCGGEEWLEPQPIQAALHAVPAFDPDTLLPEALRGWIMDEADRMPCPPDFIAVAALVELGAIIGARCAIKPKTKDDWLIVPNLWGADVGDPAAMKSPAIGAALKPLDRLNARARKEHAAALEAFEADSNGSTSSRETWNFGGFTSATAAPW